MSGLLEIEPVALWSGVITLGLMTIGALTKRGKAAIRAISRMPASPGEIRALALFLQVVCLVPVTWHIWLVEVSRREAAGGHNEEALFAAIGDGVVMRVVMALHSSLGLNPSLRVLNLIGIGTWVVIGAAMILLVRYVHRCLLVRQGHAA